ncbi:MAG: ATP-binding cassette domain-containing protein [Polyangiaceae bacterium]|jgi:molybdate transport system ATP-binding protein
MSADVRAAALCVQVHIRASERFELDVDFVVPPGVTALLGRSGSGKSTTLAAIAGLVRPHTGRVALGEDAWFDSTARIDVAVHRRRVALLFQSLALFPHMTAWQNVAYGMERRRAPRRARALEWLERLRVSHVADRRPDTFSGGEAQRVALARALASNPRVVLLDEPFTAVDTELRRELLADVRVFVRSLGVPVVLVTHDRQEAALLADRFVVLEAGRMTHVGAGPEVEG